MNHQNEKITTKPKKRLRKICKRGKYNSYLYERELKRMGSVPPCVARFNEIYAMREYLKSVETNILQQGNG